MSETNSQTPPNPVPQPSGYPPPPTQPAQPQQCVQQPQQPQQPCQPSPSVPQTQQPPQQHLQQPPQYTQPPQQVPYNYQAYSQTPPNYYPPQQFATQQPVEKDYSTKAIISFVFGILGLLFGWGIPIIGLPLNIVGFVFAKNCLKAGEDGGLLKAAKVCNLIALILSILVIVFTILAVIFAIAANPTPYSYSGSISGVW